VDDARDRARLGAAILAACAALALAACGGDDDEFTLPTTTATATGPTGATGEDGASGTGSAVEEALTEAGFGIAAVDCPDDVPLEEGDTFECEFTLDAGESGTLSISVDSADDETATLSYLGEAGDEPVEGEGVEVQK
jgi:Domain of unknown function (DUF4333)